MSDADIIIVGGGLSGLACANALRARGVRFLLLEASAQTGGRLQTEEYEGFLLDRGFQVLSTAYPEVKGMLDSRRLGLRPFQPGALIRTQSGFHQFLDPFRVPWYEFPQTVISSLASPIGSLKDMTTLAKERFRWIKNDPDPGLQQMTTGSWLRERYSERIIKRFFQPFLSGIFLESELRTPAWMAFFVLSMFARGEATLPSDGMQAVARQLTESLPDDRVVLSTKVVSVDATSVVLEGGRRLPARQVVLATSSTATASLLPDRKARPTRGTDCFYFTAPKPPHEERLLVLNGTGEGPINSLCVPSKVQRTYAPVDQHLISVSLIESTDKDPDALFKEVGSQLSKWYGDDFAMWKLLKHVRVPDALPEFSITSPLPEKPWLSHQGVFLCGDQATIGSIHHALGSGRVLGEHLAEMNATSK